MLEGVVTTSVRNITADSDLLFRISDAEAELYDMYSNLTDECAVDYQISDSCSPTEKYIKISRWMVL
jgi:hypothetical protein